MLSLEDEDRIGVEYHRRFCALRPGILFDSVMEALAEGMDNLDESGNDSGEDSDHALHRCATNQLLNDVRLSPRLSSTYLTDFVACIKGRWCT